MKKGKDRISVDIVGCRRFEYRGQAANRQIGTALVDVVHHDEDAG